MMKPIPLTINGTLCMPNAWNLCRKFHTSYSIVIPLSYRMIWNQFDPTKIWKNVYPTINSNIKKNTQRQILDYE